MPKITLKPNSAEYADSKTKKPQIQVCEMPGCPFEAGHKAPKHRGLNDYYHFCLDHVRDYNKAWNFFTGMSDHEVEDHMIDSIYGFRPTYKYDPHRTKYKKLAKMHHPDLNKNDPASEELLKKINMSYTILKLAFAQYEELEKRNS